MTSHSTPLPNIMEALLGSEFEEATSCIERVFSKLDITTIEDLEDRVPYLTCSFCMINTHKLIEHLREYDMGQEPQESEEEQEEEVIVEAPPEEPVEIQSQEEELNDG